MKLSSIYSSILCLIPISEASSAVGTHQLYIPRAPTTPDTLSALSKAFYRNRLQSREENLKNTTEIAKSWNGATLFSLEGQPASLGGSISTGIEVICTTCYVKGLVTTELRYDSDFNITQAFTNFTQDVGDEIGNITDAAVTYLKDEIPGLFRNLTHLDDISFPPLNVSLDVDLPDIPECRLNFQFDDLELYMLIDIVLSAGTRYTLNLYSSNSPIGYSTDSETFVGVVVSIDLVLSVDADIDISTGVHLRVDNGMALDLSLFSQEISSVTFNGGSFAFLPVTVQTASGVLTARLRIGLHAGISFESKELSPFIPVNTGTEVMVFADLAEFTTNLTAVPEGDDSGCEVRVQQVYQLALGAAAGATLAIGPETWGPAPSTKIPIFYTTLADECAKSATQSTAVTVIATPTPTVAARADDTTTTTLSEEVTFTGMVCISTGFAECPVSLQSTTKVTSTRTLVTEVASGSDATFPATTQDVIAETIPFSKNMKSVAATTGSPVSYTPPPPSSSSTMTPGGKDGESEGQSKKASGANNPLIIGLSVGLGVPFLAAVTAACIYFISRQRKYTAVNSSDVFQVVAPHHASDQGLQQKKSAMTMVTTIDSSSES